MKKQARNSNCLLDRRKKTIRLEFKRHFYNNVYFYGPIGRVERETRWCYSHLIISYVY